MRIAMPESPEQLEEFLNETKNRKELMEDPAAFKEFLTSYSDQFLKKDRGEVSAQIKEQMTVTLKEMYEQNETKLPETVKRLPMSPEVANGKTSGYGHGIYQKLGLNRDQQRQMALTGTGPGMDAGEWDNFAEFARGISPHITQRGIDPRVKVLGEGQGDQGGFLVPEEYRAELLMLALEQAVVRPRARVLPMAGLTVAIPAIRDASHATNVHGGVQGYWTPESGSFTQTEPTFAQARLTAKKLMGGTRISNELLRDSVITLEPLINELFGSAIAYFEDDAFIAGIGGGQPLGILNADALISISKETGQAATTLVTENIIKMYARMLPSSIMRGVWVMHPDTQTQLYIMSLSVGTGGAPMFFPAGGLSGSPSGTLLGRPIVLSEKCETLGTAGDVYFVDFSYYLIGDRMALEMASSPHTRFATDETDFRFIQRVDGRPWIDTALTPRNGSNTLSPFVSLATRS